MSALGPTAADNSRGVCPFTVERPVMTQRWEQLTFLHWRYPVDAVQRLLPAGLVVDAFEGSAWVGLVPFHMRVATAGGREMPWASTFCETNVRTYARDHEGRVGIWFLSLDAARLGAVVVARTTYRLPYFWSEMRARREGSMLHYACRRRLPGPRGTTSEVSIDTGTRYLPSELDELDHFLTARWVLFSATRHRYRFARAEHDPWPLHRGRVVSFDDHLVAAAGLRQPEEEPLVHVSPGVDVRIGRPERYR